jgi:hypothetical protein
MRKAIFILLLVGCASLAAQAQTERGSMLLGGTGTLHISTESEDDGMAFIALAPRIGYFLANNVAIGSAIPLFYSSSDNYRGTTVGITPFVRGYFGTSATRFFLEGRAGYNHSSFKIKDFDVSDSEGFFSYGAGVGVSRFLNEYVGLELLLTYDKSDADETILDIRNFTGINLNVGFQIYLPNRK